MTLADLQARVLARAGEDPNATAANMYYSPTEAVNAINTANRLFVLLTLCLETSGVFTSTLNTAFYDILQIFPNWLLPLRVRLGSSNSGAKLRPGRLSDFAALDANWSTSFGTPSKYAHLGMGFMAFYQPPAGVQTMTITYARCPEVLQLANSSPEIPAEFHPALIDGAIPLMRTKEGAQEFQKTLPMWNRYLDAAQRLGEYVRARNLEQGYDHMPVELAKFDRSHMLEVVRAKQ